MRAGARKPMKPGETAQRVNRTIDLNMDRRLPVLTKDEVGGWLNLFIRLANLPDGCITFADAKNAIPELFESGTKVWVSNDPIRIRFDQGRQGFWSKPHGRPELFIGAVIINAPLQRILGAERDFLAYQKWFQDDYDVVYPLEDSYKYGVTVHGFPFVEIDHFYHTPGRFGCLGSSMVLHLREYCSAEGRFVADYYTTSPSYYWAAGRDIYYPIRDRDRVAYLIVTQFGFDMKNCWDSGRFVKEQIIASLEYMKVKAESSRP